ncbi:hypothetical protein Sjap_011168 [Stephania japonica]|uniref:Uncharacterized protein n=1 Tax=Stephania japonica TaxID=461633 RepID=A0AAP0JCU2_9MAGN
MQLGKEMEGTLANAVRSRFAHPHLLSSHPFSSRSSSSSLGFLRFPSRLSPDRCRLRLAATISSESDPAPPPPPPNKGLDGPLSKIQDKAQIFFAVLFWMSLFFWACAWDGRSGNRPTKRSRFRR